MLEQANENSQDDTVKVVLSRMRKLGVLDSRTTEVKYGLWRYLMMESRRES